MLVLVPVLRLHTSAYVSMCQRMRQAAALADAGVDVGACLGTCIKAAYVSIRQHTSAHKALRLS